MRNEKGQFVVGHIPWQKGTKGIVKVKANSGSFKKGHIPWCKGKKGYAMSSEAKRKIGISSATRYKETLGLLQGKWDKSFSWKGNDIGVPCRHWRIRRIKGETDYCELCGKKRGKRRLDLSNIDHKYSLDPNDYQFLCASCHRKYDIKLRKLMRLQSYGI